MMFQLSLSLDSMSAGAPPTIPSSLQIYNSYVEDPKWQRKFTIIWCSGLALAIAVSLPSLILSLRRGRSLKGVAGIIETTGYRSLYSNDKNPPPAPRCRQRLSLSGRLSGFWSALVSPTYWSPPKLELNFGQILILLAYLAVVLVCIIKDAPLITNPNRAGFLALAQFPVVFLFATKNSILSLLLGPGNGYEKLNFMHKMAGRTMFLAGCIHGSLWIRNHLQYGIPILGRQKETSGVASFSLLAIIVLTSLRPVRRLFYECFFFVHVLTYVAFFVTICYHTIYASPWIFPPLAFYGADVLLRLLRYRIKDATLTTQDAHMTLIRVHNCDDGWLAGQHVRLRVFFSNRVFESHALTILSAPPSFSCLSSPGFLLAARTNGDWTRALNAYARKEQGRLEVDEKEKSQGQSQGCASAPASAFVQVMLDGPYGGSSVDLGRYERALLIAGGSGITFTLGLLDDIVGRCVKLGRTQGERTRKIEFAWSIRSFGQIEWFAPMLIDIATAASNSSSLDLQISIFVTCLCDPEAVPLIPNCTVTLSRPCVYGILEDLVDGGGVARTSGGDFGSVEMGGNEREGEGESQKWYLGGGGEGGGGVAVCASGPETLTREARNAVARMGLNLRTSVGGIALHTELFSL